MANKKLEHHSLGSANTTFQKTQIILIDANLSIPKKIKFSYASLSFSGQPETVLPDFSGFIPPRTTDLLDIHIREDCFVQMWLLRDNLDWHWRTQDAITTTEPLKSQYIRLEYRLNNAWVSNPGEDAMCQGIRFGAIKRPGPEGPRDPFNLNVILEWGPDEVLPMTIDPDIQNPKAL